jgi:2-polyprenyl-3-methyl-5-hydroxy-6-metoxy-1,4-benzoquinol methylase
MSFENDNLDFNVIREFWNLQSLKPENRWTSQSLLNFEIQKLNDIVANFNTFDILDLGCGHGTLSRSLVRTKGTLLAVDNQAAYQESFNGNSRILFQLSDIQNFMSSAFFDLILLFGVITQLDADSEDLTLNSINSMLKPDGIAVIKHQCADENSFIFNGFSHALGTQYSGRYPSRSEQRERLLRYFSSAQEIEYPSHFKSHANSSHIMFVCKKG